MSGYHMKTLALPLVRHRIWMDRWSLVGVNAVTQFFNSKQNSITKQALHHGKPFPTISRGGTSTNLCHMYGELDLQATTAQV